MSELVVKMLSIITQATISTYGLVIRMAVKPGSKDSKTLLEHYNTLLAEYYKLYEDEE